MSPITYFTQKNNPALKYFGRTLIDEDPKKRKITAAVIKHRRRRLIGKDIVLQNDPDEESLFSKRSIRSYGTGIRLARRAQRKFRNNFIQDYLSGEIYPEVSSSDLFKTLVISTRVFKPTTKRVPRRPRKNIILSKDLTSEILKNMLIKVKGIENLISLDSDQAIELDDNLNIDAYRKELGGKIHRIFTSIAFRAIAQNKGRVDVTDGRTFTPLFLEILPRRLNLASYNTTMVLNLLYKELMHFCEKATLEGAWGELKLEDETSKIYIEISKEATKNLIDLPPKNTVTIR